MFQRCAKSKKGISKVYRILVLLFVLNVLLILYEIGVLRGGHSWSKHWANICRDLKYWSNLLLIWVRFPKAEYLTELDPLELKTFPQLPRRAKECGVILDIEKFYPHMPHTAECFLRATSIWLDRARLGIDNASTVWLAPLKYSIWWSKEVMARINKKTNIAFTFSETLSILHVPKCMIQIKLRRNGPDWWVMSQVHMETIKKWFPPPVTNMQRGIKHLKVLIVNRRNSRTIQNADSLGKGLSRLLNDSGYRANYKVVSELSDFSPEEQWSLFTSNDVIVSVDGAQMTNLFFARRCSIVIEIFYPGYFNFGYFSWLAMDAGLLYGFVYLLNPKPDIVKNDPLWDYDLNPYAHIHAATGYTRRSIMRSVKGFEVSVKDAGTVLENLLAKRKKCLGKEPQARLANSLARRKLVSDIQKNLVADVEHYRFWPRALPVINESTSLSESEKESVFEYWKNMSRSFPDSSRISVDPGYENIMIILLVIQIVLLVVLLFSMSKRNDGSNHV